MADLVQIYANPKSGNFNRKRLRHYAQSYRENGCHVVITTDAPFALASTSVREVVISGGDGTLNHVMSVLANENINIPVTIIPSGTINLIARELEQDGADRWQSAYIAMAGTHALTACLSVGPDARIVANVSLLLKSGVGRLAYVFSFLKCLVRWNRETIRLRYSGRTVECGAVYLAKGKYYAGGWSFARDARISSDQLFGVYLRSCRRRDYLSFLFAMAVGRVHLLKNVTSFECDSIEILGNHDTPVQIDGDALGKLPVSLAVRPTPIAIRLMGNE